MPQISPEEMAAMQEQAGQDNSGKATALVKSVGEGLAQLSEMLNSSKGVTDADREQMAMVMNGFIDLVEKKLGGSAPGQDAPPEELPADEGAVPMQGGRTGKPMGPQNRM